jgi:hypothetical protein
MCADRGNANIYLATATAIYKSENGRGDFVLIRDPDGPGTINSMAANGTSSTIYLGDASTIYVADGGPGNWDSLGAVGVTIVGMDVNYIDGAVVYAAANNISRRPENSISSYIAY